MRKIAVFSNMYPSGQHPTFGIFVKNQVELLRSKGVDVDIIAINDPAKGKSAAVKKYGTWLFRSFFYMLKNRKRLTLTHAHYAFPTGLISLMGKRIWKLPYVVTVHGGDIDKMAKKGGKIASMTTSILQNAEAVIVVGERLKQDVIQTFGVHAQRVHVMSMGVDTAVFKPFSKEETRKELDIPAHEKVVLYVGNLIEAKGLLELVEAFKLVKKEIPEASLYLIGSPKDEGFMDKLAKHLVEHGVKVVQQMPKPQKEIAQWMAASDVFVLPSHHEGFGLVVLEAMATGTKVVGTNVGGLSYLLADQAGILVQPKNPESLAAGIRQVLNGEAALDQESIRSAVESNSFDTISERLQSIYRSIEEKAGRTE
ncbi:glycosyltransferase [Sporosarcina sp. Te-1]|uniref:glycosyltransferase n=1 Tax=Sporosarcina sp. Te-1 TaxID=2818390 RepID=UPI001A9DC6FC|nr:glycosyltransferase [Sporosarcina sp. Te-1]QTD41115.1 glycosyltransferase [Sporosarcina sp. Te-1]